MDNPFLQSVSILLLWAVGSFVIRPILEPKLSLSEWVKKTYIGVILLVAIIFISNNKNIGDFLLQYKALPLAVVSLVIIIIALKSIKK